MTCELYNFLHGNGGGLEAGIVIIYAFNHVCPNTEHVHNTIVALSASTEEGRFHRKILRH